MKVRVQSGQRLTEQEWERHGRPSWEVHIGFGRKTRQLDLGYKAGFWPLDILIEAERGACIWLRCRGLEEECIVAGA
jgi:hypothetical protein